MREYLKGEGERETVSEKKKIVSSEREIVRKRERERCF